MINLKQKELIDKMFKTAKDKFPEISLKEITVSPDDPEHIWVNIGHNFSEDNLLNFYDFAAELDINTLMDFGYKISLMPMNTNFVFS